MGARGEREERRADPPDGPAVLPHCPEGGTRPAYPPAQSGTVPGGESGSGAGLRAGGPPSCRLPPHSPPPPLPPHMPGVTPAVRLAPGLASLANTVDLMNITLLSLHLLKINNENAHLLIALLPITTINSTRQHHFPNVYV